MKVGIIGAGNIGSVLCKKVKQIGWSIQFVLKNDGVYKNQSEKIDSKKNYKKYFDKLDIVFLAIPTIDDGSIAYEYMKYFLEKNIPVVTCEKGALSNYFSELEKWKDKIGYSATVGGGTRLLRYVEERISPSTQEIHSVINGTLNYIFDELLKGISLSDAVSEAQRLGYVEPGSKNSLEVINKEAVGDIPMKTAILFNFANVTKKKLRAKDIKINKITEKTLNQLIKKSNKMRYIVSITREKNEKQEIIGGFNHTFNDWNISGGFKNIGDSPLYTELVPSGVNNAVIIYEGKFGNDGTYKLSGQGAGAGPTASSMIKDAIMLKGLK
jgi:homoserine dehydrogenase